TGSGLIKQGDSVNVEGVNGNSGNNTEVHYTDYTLPDMPSSYTTSPFSETTDSGSSDGSSNNLNGYIVGTNVDGSSDKPTVNNTCTIGLEIP
ncbi:hypothetical protein OFC49_32740, partial [Escherichia coli]|nr:hypothetical protein [Escherichia coli]